MSYNAQIQQEFIFLPISAPIPSTAPSTPWNLEAIQMSRELIRISDHVKRLQERLSRLVTHCEGMEVVVDRAERRAYACEQTLQVKEIELLATQQHVVELQGALREVTKESNSQRRYIDQLHKKIAEFSEHKERGPVKRQVRHTRPALMWKPKSQF